MGRSSLLFLFQKSFWHLAACLFTFQILYNTIGPHHTLHTTGCEHMPLIKEHVKPSTICKPLHEVVYCAATLYTISKYRYLQINQGVRAQAQNTLRDILIMPLLTTGSRNTSDTGPQE